MAKDPRTEVTTAARNARRQKVVVEYHEVLGGPEWHVMHADGRVEVLDTASAVLAAVKARARRGNRGVTLTSIEWRDTPDGWTPPQA